MSADDTICSYDIETNGNVTTRHRKYIMKLPTHADNADGLEDTTVAGSTATAQVSRSMRALAANSSVTDRIHYSPVKHHGSEGFFLSMMTEIINRLHMSTICKMCLSFHFL